jgi:S-adenosylmethionine hydrolase
MKFVTFSSDFGLEDGYVGSVQGVLLQMCPDIKIINVTHSIEPFRIEKAAYLLVGYYNNFPKGTVHIIVVDPGVGSERKPVILRTANYYFVGPDNGIFSYLISKEAYTAYTIDIHKIKKFNPVGDLSATFHARDLFAPTAALIAKGIRPEHIGSIYAGKLVSLPNHPDYENDFVTSHIINIDRFGNITCNFTRFDLERITRRSIKKVSIKGKSFNKIHNTYSDVKQGEFLALWGSAGFLEIAMNQGNAAENLECNADKDTVQIVLDIKV